LGKPEKPELEEESELDERPRFPFSRSSEKPEKPEGFKKCAETAEGLECKWCVKTEKGLRCKPMEKPGKPAGYKKCKKTEDGVERCAWCVKTEQEERCKPLGKPEKPELEEEPKGKEFEAQAGGLEAEVGDEVMESLIEADDSDAYAPPPWAFCTKHTPWDWCDKWINDTGKHEQCLFDMNDLNSARTWCYADLTHEACAECRDANARARIDYNYGQGESPYR